MNHTFYGPDWRAQVTVLECKGLAPRFVIYVLRANERPSVPFRGCGDRVYFGIDSDVALSRLIERVPDALRQMPPSMKSFFRR